MSTTLLPCPHCGCSSIAIKNTKPADLSGGYFIECPDCGASTGLRYALGDDPRPLLAEAWNRRTPTAAAAAPASQAVLDYPWRDRLLDGRPLDRDKSCFAEHPELPVLDEGMKPRAFFAALGIELRHTMAEDDLSIDEYDAISDAEDWSAWTPRPPAGEAWKLIAIFDTEDGPAAWWARKLTDSQPTTRQESAADAT